MSKFKKTKKDEEVEVVVDATVETNTEVEGEVVTENYDVDTVVLEEDKKTSPQVQVSDLEVEFNQFKRSNTVKTMKITETIQMMELDSVKDMILDAKAKIEDYAQGNSSSFISRAKSSVAALPLIGGFAKKSIEAAQRTKDENSNINEVFKGLFNNFTTKQDRIIELIGMLDGMRRKIEEQTEYVYGIIDTTNKIIEANEDVSEVFRAKRLNEMARTTMLKNEDKVENKIKPALMLAGKSLENMNKILPSLESDMLDELGINGALNSFKDVNVMLKETMDLASNITQISAENTETLMLEVMQIADTSSNVKYIEDAQNRRLGFQKKFEKEMTDSMEKQEQNYQKVKEISDNYTKNETLSAMIESYSSTALQLENK